MCRLFAIPSIYLILIFFYLTLVDSQSCNGEDGVDYYGNDIVDLNPGRESAEACCEECQNRTGCVAWSMQKENSWPTLHRCWLKHTAGNRILNPDRISGVLGSVVPDELPIWEINKELPSRAVEDALITNRILSRVEIAQMKETISSIRFLIAQKHGKQPSPSELDNRHILINDMLYDQDQLNDWKHELEFEANRRGKRQMYLNGKWPRNEVGWISHKHLDPAALSAIQGAIAEFHSKTNVKFREIPATANIPFPYVFVTSNSNGCYSNVGYGTQPAVRILNLGPGCRTTGTAIHELMHAIGFNHHQTRSDRDNYVKINWDNIKSGKEINFEKNNWSLLGQSRNYNFGSIMHYGSDFFSSNGGLTMETSNAGNQHEITTPRRTFSQLDLQGINVIYSRVNSPDPYPAILNSICPDSLSNDRLTKLQCEELDDVCIKTCQQPSKSRACYDCYSCTQGTCILTTKPIRVDNQDAQACSAPRVECYSDGCCEPGAQCQSGRCYTPEPCSSRNARCGSSDKGCCKSYEKCTNIVCDLSDDLPRATGSEGFGPQ